MIVSEAPLKQFDNARRLECGRELAPADRVADGHPARGAVEREGLQANHRPVQLEQARAARHGPQSGGAQGEGWLQLSVV